MIHAAHFVLYSTDPAADRAFLKDVLDFPFVDDGDGWLIFKLPPAEMGVHPFAGDRVPDAPAGAMQTATFYLLTDDLESDCAQLLAKGIELSDPSDADWGRSVLITMSSGGKIGLYQPTHETALGM